MFVFTRVGWRTPLSFGIVVVGKAIHSWALICKHKIEQTLTNIPFVLLRRIAQILAVVVTFAV
jgi:hypothetical protein